MADSQNLKHRHEGVIVIDDEVLAPGTPDIEISQIHPEKEEDGDDDVELSASQVIKCTQPPQAKTEFYDDDEILTQVPQPETAPPVENSITEIHGCAIGDEVEVQSGTHSQRYGAKGNGKWQKQWYRECNQIARGILYLIESGGDSVIISQPECHEFTRVRDPGDDGFIIFKCIVKQAKPGIVYADSVAEVDKWSEDQKDKRRMHKHRKYMVRLAKEMISELDYDTKIYVAQGRQDELLLTLRCADMETSDEYKRVWSAGERYISSLLNVKLYAKEFTDTIRKAVFHSTATDNNINTKKRQRNSDEETTDSNGIQEPPTEKHTKIDEDRKLAMPVAAAATSPAAAVVTSTESGKTATSSDGTK